jgi:hypothetical protein
MEEVYYALWFLTTPKKAAITPDEMKHILPLLLLSFALMASCQSTRQSPGEYEGQSLRFGSGGGFTGMVTTYCLLDNGHLYQQDAMPGQEEASFEHVKKVSKKTCKALFTQANEAYQGKQNTGTPGNMTNFIELELEEGKARYQWDSGQAQEDSPIQQLYRNLSEVVKE